MHTFEGPRCLHHTCYTILPSGHHWITVITKKLATIRNALTNEEKHKNLQAQQAYN